MSNISNERLEEVINGDIFYTDEQRELASELLAYREAGKEPVAWTDAEELRDVERGGCGYLFKANPITPHADDRRVIKLYTAPTLAAAKINHQSNIHSSADAGSVAEIKQPSSMLNAVPELTNGQILDFLAVAFRHCRIVGDIDFDDIRLGLKLAIDASPDPVVPDGWVMVPKEPTDEMCDVSHIGIDVYTGITKDDEYYSTGGKDAAKIYLAMLAAAPQPEETDNTKAQYESLSK